MELSEEEIWQAINSLEIFKWEDLKNWEHAAKHNLDCAESKVKTKRFRMEKGFSIEEKYWNNAEKNLSFAQLLSKKVKDEIERRLAQPTKVETNIHVNEFVAGNKTEYHGDYSGNINSQINSPIIQLKREEPVIIKRVVKWCMGIVAGVVIGYILYRFGWI